MPLASTVLMVRPASFGFNTETAASNHFQQRLNCLSASQIQALAVAEFDRAVAGLREAGVGVRVVEDTVEPATPDAIFPNNWLSLHPDGRAVRYPMRTRNRRAERRDDVLTALSQEFKLTSQLDLTAAELEGRYLEGTGSVVFDHEARVAYAALSPRTDVGLLRELCNELNYQPLPFAALDAQGQPIYHTNVLMSIGPGFAVLCAESIRDPAERAAVTAALTTAGHEIVEISLAQVGRFAGNVLALQGAAGPVLAMSASAYQAFTSAQRAMLGRYAELLPLAIPTIETIGGGSVRCMLAEVFLPPA